MAESAEIKTKRIAKNTGLLYLRSFITMLIGLFTSRVMLEALGVDNYGINNVVGGFVAMFSVVTGTLTSSINRYITYGLGKADIKQLQITVSTSFQVLFWLGLTLFILAESFGLWFVNTHLDFPPGRLYAANWVYQFAVLSSVMGIMALPFGALIVAHERMNIYAYMAIIDVAVKLLLCYLLFIVPFDRLIFYSGLYFFVEVGKTIFGWWYCSTRFPESHYIKTFDKTLFKDISKFAGWTFFGNTSWIFNNQGVNMLLNIFFGVVINAARGIAQTVFSAVMSFVYTFETAFSPQITKSYAEGDMPYFYSIMERGSKFSIYLMMIMVIPLMYEADTVLHLWLGNYPAYSPIFLRLSLISAATLLIGNSFFKGIMAKGDIRKYTIAVNIVAWLDFPLTWLAFKMGMPVEWSYYIFIIVYAIVVLIRVWFVEKLLGYPMKRFFSNVLFPILFCVIIASVPPFFVHKAINSEWLRLISVSAISVVSTCSVIYLIGVNSNERKFIIASVRKPLNQILYKIGLKR